MAPKYASKKEILGVSRIGAKGFLLVLASGSGSRAPLHTESVAHRNLAPRWLPGRDIKQEFPWRLQPITVSSFNLEKVELSHSQGWLTKTVNAPFQAFETLASFYV
jgi:hypothetical protein